jgi:hypothetical protein
MGLDDMYAIYKPRIGKYISTLSKSLETISDYSTICLAMLDDFFKITEDIGDIKVVMMEEFMFYISVASFWIVDKYIEDDPLLLSDIIEETPDGTEKDELFIFERILFNRCPNIHVYII